jgi:hypothetical protein
MAGLQADQRPDPSGSPHRAGVQDRTNLAMASEASLIFASPSEPPSRAASATQCLRWSSSRPRATPCRAEVRAEIWVRMSMVLLFLDHAVDAAGLALDSLQPGQVTLLVADVAVMGAGRLGRAGVVGARLVGACVVAGHGVPRFREVSVVADVERVPLLGGPGRAGGTMASARRSPGYCW